MFTLPGGVRSMVLAAAVSVACTETPTSAPTGERLPTALPAGEELLVVVSTTGGVAGFDWQITFDGDARSVRLDRCEPVCPWGSATTRTLTVEQVEEVARLFLDADVRSRPEHDFGLCEFCADQFHHVIEYRDETGEYRLEGDEPNLPLPLREALNLVIWAETPNGTSD